MPTRTIYEKIYIALMERAKNRNIPKSEYRERHHIIPKSFGGSNMKHNIAELTAREHYIAHALLWKMKFPFAYGSKMAFAFNTFINKMTTSERGINHTYTISSRMYEAFRKSYAYELREKYARDGHPWKGRSHSEDSKKKIGEKSKLKVFKRGVEHHSWGKKLDISEEIKQKRRQIVQEMWRDPEKKDEMLKNRAIANQRPEVIVNRKAASDARIGVRRDPEVIEKCAKHKRGKKWEEIYNQETIERMRNAIISRVIPQESKDRIKEGALIGASAPMPEHVKKQVGNRFRGRTDLIGENNGMYGKKHSKESIEKGKEVKRKNREAKITSGWVDPRKGVYTEHQQTILKKAKEAQMVRVSCLYCRTEANLSNHKRWHGENCKMKNQTLVLNKCE
jgi:hypothetical protein